MTERPVLFPSAFHPHVGGVEELTRQLAHEESRRGMRPLIVTNQWPRDLPSEDEVDELPVRRLPFRVPGAHLRHLLGWATRAPSIHRATREVVKEWGSDVIHVQCVSSNAPYAGRASRDLDLPFVVSSHGELTMDANHAFERSSTARSILRSALAEADIITGCSRYVLDEIDRFSQGRHSSKMRVIYNGIDLKECGQAVAEVRNRPYLLGLGRLVPQKGYDVLIRSFKLLASDLPDHELLIAGDGPTSRQLRDLARALEIESRVHFLGWVDHRRALDLMAGADAFVLCSQHEPQGIVLLEAMAVGCPVFASSGGGVPEIVDDSNGVLFPIGDYRALAHRLHEVLSDESSKADFCDAGRETAAQFSLETLTSQYQDAYDDARA